MNWKTLLAVGAILFSGIICAQPISPDITLSGSDFDAISGYSAVVYVPASDEEVQQGYQWFHIPEDGLYAFKYTWLNDKSGTGFDVNIRIDSVFFDKWPPRRN